VNQELICLASASPRRLQLLGQIGVCCEQRPVEVDETPRPGEAPADFVRRVALDKATTGWRAGAGGRVVIGADTAVVADGNILGKPRDTRDAEAMLRHLSGRSHDVLTAVAAVLEGERDCLLSTSRVTFKTLAAAEIRHYVATGEPADKAGAYAIQGLAAVFVARLEGSYSGVMGLPLYETATLLTRFGVNLFSPDPEAAA
jgi:septum formation protein